MEAIELKNRMILLVTSLVVLAFPAAAAATELRMTNESGALIPAGTEITGTANDTTLRLVTTDTTLGDLECESVMLNGQLTHNSGGVVEGTGKPGSTTSKCRYTPSGKEANVGNIELSNISSSVTGVGAFEVKYEAVIPGGAVCKFETGVSGGTFTFFRGSHILEIAGTEVESAACGESILEGKVTLETTPAASGGAVVGV